MSPRSCIGPLVLAAVAAFAPLAGSAEPLPGKQAVEPVPGKQVYLSAAKDGVELSHLLFLPADYPRKAAWPLLVFLHGSGERGEDAELLKKHGPPKIVETRPDFPFVVLSPQCPLEKRWEPAVVARLIERVARERRVDASRIYLTGLSMGGSGSWELAAAMPERFAAVVPICGLGDVQAVDKLAKVPIWSFVGGKDRPATVEGNQRLAAALEKAGGTFRFTLDAQAGHDCWTKAYADPALYDWLLLHSRPAAQGR